MFFGKDYPKSDRRRRNLNSSGLYDTINIVLGLGVIITSIIIFIDRVKYDKAFTVVFLLAAVMNICMGIKYYQRSEIIKMIALFIAGIFLFAMMVISFIALWK